MKGNSILQKNQNTLNVKKERKLKEKIINNKKWILLGIASLSFLLIITCIITISTVALNSQQDMEGDKAEVLDASFIKNNSAKDLDSDNSNANETLLTEEETESTEESVDEDNTLAETEEIQTLSEEESQDEPENSNKNIDEKVISTKYDNITFGKIGELSSKDIPLAISTAKDFVNIRELPNTESKILGKLYSNNVAAVTGIEDDWVLIESGSVKGYVTSEYLNTELTKDEVIEQFGKLQATTTVNGLNVREEANEEANRLTVIYENEKYSVLEVLDEWVKISIDKGSVIGFVSKEYVDLNVKFDQAISIEEEQAIIRQKKEEEERKAKAAEEAKKKAAEEKTAAEKAAEEKAAKKASSKKKSSGSKSTSSKASKKQAPKTESRAATSHEDSDLKLLACLVHSESGNQPYEGKLAVANVVLNRVKSSKYPGSISKVIYQSGQFTVAKNGSLQKQLDKYSNYSSKSQKSSIKAAKAALAGENNIGSLLYFNGYSKNLENKHPNGVRISGHLFW